MVGEVGAILCLSSGRGAGKPRLFPLLLSEAAIRSLSCCWLMERKKKHTHTQMDEPKKRIFRSLEFQCSTYHPFADPRVSLAFLAAKKGVQEGVVAAIRGYTTSPPQEGH